MSFRATLTTRGPGFPDEALWKFADLVLLSEFYFSRLEHEAMQELLDNGNQVKARHDHWQHTKESSDGDTVAAANAMHKLHRETRDKCGVVADMLKPDLLLESSKPRWLM